MIMKYKVSHLITAGAMLFIGAANVRAQVYLNGDVGASFIQNVPLRNSGGKSASFNPGARGGFSVGYDLSDCFAVELETGAIWNSVDKVGGQSLSSGANADLYQVPLLANLIYKTPVKSGFSAFFGAGAGGIASIFSANSPGTPSTPPPVGTGAVARVIGTFKSTGGIGSGSGFSGSDTDYTFAYQGVAGVKYAFCKNMDIGITYKFLGTLDHHWTIAGSGVSTDAIYTHSVLAAFTLRF